MFREKITYPYVREIKKSIFWKECQFCGVEFKKEKYYEVTKQYMNGTIGRTYACNRCFNHVDEVYAKLEQIRNWRPDPFPKKKKSIDTSTLCITEDE